MQARKQLERACLIAMALAWPATGYGGVSLELRGLPACAPGFTESQTTIRPAGQVHHAEEAEVTFHGRPTEAGGIEVEGRGGDLVFKKTSHASGGFTLDLQGPDDAVQIGVSIDGVTIARSDRVLALSFDGASESDVEDARVLLAGSPAVHLTRLAAAAVEQSGDDSASATALLIGDALVGLLAGDPGAPGRVARHLARHTRGVLRRVATTDCFNEWERRALTASYEWETCARAFSVWNPVRNLCAFRWLLQVESYWFTFLSCTGFRSF
jgi:hypothetical protein